MNKQTLNRMAHTYRMTEMNQNAKLEAMVSRTPYTPYPLVPWIDQKVRDDYRDYGKLVNQHLCK